LRREVGDRADNQVRKDGGALDRIRPELPRADENRAQAEALAAGNVPLEVVADDPGQLGIGVERLEGGGEVRGARLAQHGRLDAGASPEPGAEEAGVEPGAAAGLPPAVLVQAVELRPALELRERAGEVHVAEDPPGLLGVLVGAAEEDGIGTLADELDPL